jgi:hypothetical protein
MPDAGDDFDLKEVVRPIILAQGNKYIKELLRKHKIRIGLTKADFERNIFDAIDKGTLTREMVEAWLLEVEGWGNQHVYLLVPPDLDRKGLEAAIKASDYADRLGTYVSYDFPETLSMTAVRLGADDLAIDWHIGSSGWERDKLKDYRQEIEGDLYEFRAYRDRSDRTVVRFEWRFGTPYSSLFTQLPNAGETHADTMRKVFADLSALGVAAAPLGRISLSQAVKVATQDEEIVALSTKMMADGGYIEMVSTLTDGGIGDVEPIRRARQGVEDEDFRSADGMLSFPLQTYKALSRDIKATVYGSEGRFRIWVQCKRDDIYTVADLIWQKNT